MDALNRVLQSIAHKIYRAFCIFAAIAFAILLTMLFVNVLFRNFGSGSISEIEECSKFVFVWMMFMGIAIGVYHKKHLGVTFIVEKYNEKISRLVKTVSDLLTMVFFLILIIFGFKYCFSTMKMLTPIMGWPYGIIYMCMPLCGIFSLFYCICIFVDDICKKGGEKK